MTLFFPTSISMRIVNHTSLMAKNRSGSFVHLSSQKLTKIHVKPIKIAKWPHASLRKKKKKKKVSLCHPFRQNGLGQYGGVETCPKGPWGWFQSPPMVKPPPWPLEVLRLPLFGLGWFWPPPTASMGWPNHPQD